MKKIILLTTLILFLAVGKVSAQESEILYFYSDSCSYCQNVLQFIEENSIEEKLSFTKIDISTTEGENLFNEKAAECQLSEFDTGVPMLYAEGDCSVAQDSVQNKFLELTGDTNDTPSELITTEEGGGSLSESINEAPPIGFGLISSIILIPSILIGIAYLLIKGFKL